MSEISLHKSDLLKILDNDRLVVDYLIEIHQRLEANFNIFDNRNGYSASYVALVRGLSLLVATNDLLKKGMSSEAQILYRTIHEADILSFYFCFSHLNNENNREINSWFKKKINLDLKKVRNYVSNISDIHEYYLADLFGDYSKLLHHTYASMMESYKHYYNFSPLRAKEKREGFEYYKSPLFGEIVYNEYLDIVHQYQNLLNLTLMTFKIVFSKAYNLIHKKDEELLIKYMKFYSSPKETKLRSI